MLLPVLYIHICALSAHTRAHVVISASATRIWLAATSLSLPRAGTDYFDIRGLIVLHVCNKEQRKRMQIV
jgi:hypothetical protein